MPSHDILGNDALVAPAALARAIVPLLVSYTARDRRFVQEMQDQSIKRGSSAKELGDRRDAANCSKWPPWATGHSHRDFCDNQKRPDEFVGQFAVGPGVDFL